MVAVHAVKSSPLFRQHFLNRLPDPHGQRSFLLTFSASSLLAWTIRTPRLTCFSDGNPFLRLDIGSKKTAEAERLVGHLLTLSPLHLPDWTSPGI